VRGGRRSFQLGETIAHLRRSLAESVIYELHVRGFTNDPSSGVENPGTYLGVIEKIPYLKSLGVTARRTDAGPRVPHGVAVGP